VLLSVFFLDVETNDNYQDAKTGDACGQSDGRSDPRCVEHDRVQTDERGAKTRISCYAAQLFRRLSAMNAEIKTKRIGSKWHGFIEGRPDIDETALSEEVARRKIESVRARLGDCGSRTKLFGGLACELVKGHAAPVGKRLQHACEGKFWIDLSPEDGRKQ